MRRSVLSAVFCAVLSASPAWAYYGYSSTEVTLRFEGAVDVKPDKSAAAYDLLTLRPGGDRYKDARGKVEEQVSYLIGTFQSPSFVKEFGSAGTLGQVEYAEVTFLGADPGPDGSTRLRYRFEGPAVFRKKAFARGGSVREIPLKMPYAPDEIFKRANAARKSACITDKDYESEDDFFYFWDPDMNGCPLKGDSTDVLRGQGTIEKREDGSGRRATYPDYGRLYGDDGDGSELNVAVFLGYTDDVEKLGRRNVNTKDDAYVSFLALEKRMGELGFAHDRKESRARFRLDSLGREYPQGGINFLEVWKKSGTWRGHAVDLRVRIVLTDSMWDSKDATFHHLLGPALRESDLLVYDGHSGLGGNLDLSMDALKGTALDKDKYQVFFFNGCSGYSYFPKMYFDAKGGGRNLRLLASGLSTDTDTSTKNILAFLEPFLKLENPSWRALLKAMDASNADSDNVLYGVNGDGRDEWRP